MTSITLAWLNLRRRPVSTGMAVLSLAVALGFGGVLLALFRSASGGLSRIDPAVDVVIGPKASGLELVLDGLHFSGESAGLISYETIKSVYELGQPKHVMPVVHFARCRGVPVIGTDASWFQRPPDVRAPALASGEWFSATGEVVLGSEVARKLDLNPGDSCMAESLVTWPEGKPVWQRELKVTGVLRPTGHSADRVMLTDIRSAWRLQQTAVRAGLMDTAPRGFGVSYLLVTMDPLRPRLAESLRKGIHELGGEQVIVVKEEMARLRELLGRGRLAAGGVAGFLVLLSASIAAMLFTERFETLRLELGLLRAMGYPRGSVGAVLFLEGLLLACAGVAAGILLQLLVLGILPRLWHPAWMVYGKIFDEWVIVLWAGTLAASLLAIGLPLLRLYRWDASEALRGH